MQCSNVDVIKMKVLEHYKLYLQFSDGKQGDVDISPLKDERFFAGVTINPDIGTICWKNGADISPTYLHKNIKSKKN